MDKMVTYDIELNDEKKTYRLILKLPAAPILKTLNEHLSGNIPTEGYLDVLTLFPDPRMIKNIFAEIIEVEKKGYVAQVG